MGYKLPKIYATPYTAKRLELELSNAGLELSRMAGNSHDRARQGGPGRSRQRELGFLGQPFNAAVDRLLHRHAGRGNILHTGDFKMDLSPCCGGLEANEEQFRRIVSKPVDLLLLDSTGAEQDKDVVTEQDVRESLHEVIAKNPGTRLIVAVMTGYEENLASVAKVAAEEKRTLWVA